MKKIDRNKHVWEGWTVGDFIDDLEPTFDYCNRNFGKNLPFTTKQDIRAWCKENQPYYKKHIPDVANHFINRWEQGKLY